MRFRPPNISSDPARLHDIDGLMRMVSAAIDIKRRALRADQIEQFLNDNTGQYADPYTGKAFQWNGERHTLYFRGRSGKTEAQQLIEVRVF